MKLRERKNVPSVCLLLVWGNVAQEGRFLIVQAVVKERKASGSLPVLSHLVCIPIFHLHYWLRYFESFSHSSHNRPIKTIMHYESWHPVLLLTSLAGVSKTSSKLQSWSCSINLEPVIISQQLVTNNGIQPEWVGAGLEVTGEALSYKNHILLILVFQNLKTKKNHKASVSRSWFPIRPFCSLIFCVMFKKVS